MLSTEDANVFAGIKWMEAIEAEEFTDDISEHIRSIVDVEYGSVVHVKLTDGWLLNFFPPFKEHAHAFRLEQERRGDGPGIYVTEITGRFMGHPIGYTWGRANRSLVRVNPAWCVDDDLGDDLRESGSVHIPPSAIASWESVCSIQDILATGKSQSSYRIDYNYLEKKHRSWYATKPLQKLVPDSEDPLPDVPKGSLVRVGLKEFMHYFPVCCQEDNFAMQKEWIHPGFPAYEIIGRYLGKPNNVEGVIIVNPYNEKEYRGGRIKVPLAAIQGYERLGNPKNLSWK
ncbi:MAG TPA: hypothetical protein VJ110_03530 [Candidatus Nanoarchaeia archaeon]|nr:hypothetical protein [Candidatus Nanoarchaeia archaeon]